MDPKNFIVVLLAFCTTLLLGFGVSFILGATRIDICNEAYCYVIIDFIQFYRTVFLTFGVGLTVITTLGFMGQVLRNKQILRLYARLLFFTLVGVLMIICAGILAKGPIQLRSNLFTALRTYGDDCRITASVDELQKKFQCCGIDRANDWTYLFNKSILEIPTSCCNLNLMSKNTEYDTDCISIYPKGCLGPLGQLFWRSFSIMVLLVAVIALKSTVAIICTYKLINTHESNPRHLLSKENLGANSPTAVLNAVYHLDDHLIEKSPVRQ